MMACSRSATALCVSIGTSENGNSERIFARWRDTLPHLATISLVSLHRYTIRNQLARWPCLNNAMIQSQNLTYEAQRAKNIKLTANPLIISSPVHHIILTPEPRFIKESQNKSLSPRYRARTQSSFLHSFTTNSGYSNGSHQNRNNDWRRYLRCQQTRKVSLTLRWLCTTSTDLLRPRADERRHAYPNNCQTSPNNNATHGNPPLAPPQDYQQRQQQSYYGPQNNNGSTRAIDAPAAENAGQVQGHWTWVAERDQGAGTPPAYGAEQMQQRGLEDGGKTMERYEKRS